jgi:type IV secretion system protein VirB9
MNIADRFKCSIVNALIVAAVLGTSFSQAETVPAKGVTDARIREAAYDNNQVYKLRGYIGYQIDLEFQPGESFVGLGAGDIDGLSFVGQDNHLFLKPKAPRVATNITVLTNRRHYHLDYSALSQRQADADEVIYALRFTYPAEADTKSAAELAASHLNAQLEQGTIRSRNLDYWYCGESTLQPVEASDDGVHTRLRFAANADLPAIFVRNDDDSESLLNFSMDAGDVVIHRVARRFVLRRGKLTGCIVNQGYVGGGSRLESGTVAPGVERHVHGGVP